MSRGSHTRPGWTHRLLLAAVGGCLLGFLPAQAAGADTHESPAAPMARVTPLPSRSPGRTGFTALPARTTGIAFTNWLPETRHLTNQILLNGAGVTLGDADGDGLPDVYFCSSDGANALYRNLGNWRFTNVTATAGVACRGLTSTGAAFADLDGDGDLDLVVNTLGNGTRLFRNEGQARFVPFGEVLNPGRGAMTAALADVDGDGFLDLYVANYRTSALMDLPNARATFKTVEGRLLIETVNGRPMTAPDLTNRFRIGPRGAVEENGDPDVLYRNVGGSRFVAVPFTDGAFLDEDGKPLAAAPLEWGLTAAFRDLNDDGRPDLYVCNDFQTLDRVWLNQGDGRFRLVPRLAFRKHSMFSMAVDFADVNRDGLLDLFTLDMMSREHGQRMRYMGDRDPLVSPPGVFDDRPQYGLNLLFVNRGDGTYAEVGQLAGVEAAEWAWSCLFLDVDLDGWEDLLAVNGMERAARDMDVVDYLKRLRATRQMTDAEIFRERRAFPRLATANLAFRNRHDLTFEETGAAWGFNWKGVSQSMATADLDQDGDLDLVVNNLNAAPLLLRNDTPAPRVAVRLRGASPNTRGVGARIRVTAPGLPVQTHEIAAGGRYLAGDDALRSFAAGSPANRVSVEVRWPGGRRSVLAEAPADCLVEFDEARAEPAPPPPTAPPPKTWFEDISPRLGHRHHEEAFDDFARQPLLPNRLSQLGPGVAWFDVNADGWDDLVIPSGKGGSLGVLTNEAGIRFRAATNGPPGQTTPRDQIAALGWRRGGDRAASLLVSAANYEDGLTNSPTVVRYRFGTDTPPEGLPPTEFSPGPLALADLEGDGDLDLFVGGRVIPGKYPFPAGSCLFRQEAANGQFTQDDTASARQLTGLGLVTAAVFTDLTGDGFPELVVACDWGPIEVFRNDRGALLPWDVPLRWSTDPTPPPPATTRPASLARLTGWWNSVAAADLDGDGRLDLVAGNWGRNTRYEAHRSRPLRLYYGDLGGQGRTDLIEAHFDTQLGHFVPERQLDALASSLPFLRGIFPTHRAYSRAPLEEVLADRLADARLLEAAWLETTAFLNRGDHFEPRVLPLEAQVAPVFGLAATDFDGDGLADLFLAQNFFGAQPDTPRYDAGRGLVLRGDGTGAFTPLTSLQSGVAVDGEQRGAAAADFDRDGRVDFAVAQNGAETRLFRNHSARPGLRLRFEAGPENPDGVGVQVRGIFQGRPGPALEVRAGGGYASQDSPVLVLTGATPPEALVLRWPGGKETRATVPAGARELRLSPTTVVPVDSP